MALNFVGSIFNVKSTYEPLIEDFLDRNSVVSTTVDSTLSSYLSLLEPLNYTIDLTSKGDNYVVTDRYVFFGKMVILQEVELLKLMMVYLNLDLKIML